ncbi:MAG: biotin--[acetyl-CoA-carboxylase] ligase [Phaeodactylibacter sp.]|nr:biotin--[acetyl-CoA-carboxylase] ligase [Phaeodactylibacter sp.]MCB9272751.1 biotin--[acetyl-CoA-carboxylase] ligase [Lewinellaceae bacterium]
MGKVLMEFPSLPSTNLYASELLSKSKPSEGTVISAGFQTEGRGQIGSRWESQAGLNITLSVILYPEFLPAAQQFSLNQAVALSVRDLAARYAKKPVYVKWPNDIYLGHRKVAGILLQNTLSSRGFQSCVAGLGINVNQESFSPALPNPTSLKLETGRPYSLPELRTVLFQCLEQRYLQLKEGRFDSLNTEYLQFLYGLGHVALFERPDGERFRGKINGISPEGLLLVVAEGGQEDAYQLKAIKMVGPPEM